MGGDCAVPRFFVDLTDASPGETIKITGEDARHISLSLRARVKETYTLCGKDGLEYLSEIENIDSQSVTFVIIDKKTGTSEPSVKVTLYQALVKGDKFDEIVQKAVELGASEIVPVISARCVSKPDGKTLEKKTARWQKIAKEAAMQSGRAIIPTVGDALSYKEALEKIKKCDCGFVCYESEPHIPLKKILEETKKGAVTCGFLIGPEGGLSDEERKTAQGMGIPLASLGERILRTETAPLCVLSAIMFYSGNLE